MMNHGQPGSGIELSSKFGKGSKFHFKIPLEETLDSDKSGISVNSIAIIPPMEESLGK